MDFIFQRRIQFYETDLMGIVHHSNYIRLCEEARVAWAVSRGLIDYQKPESAFQLAVLKTEVRHLRPTTFGNEVGVEVRVRLEGVKLVFAYRLYNLNPNGDNELVCVAKTVHAAVDKNLKPMRPPPSLKTIMTKEAETHPWIETWLLSL